MGEIIDGLVRLGKPSLGVSEDASAVQSDRGESAGDGGPGRDCGGAADGRIGDVGHVAREHVELGVGDDLERFPGAGNGVGARDELAAAEALAGVGEVLKVQSHASEDDGVAIGVLDVIGGEDVIGHNSP